MDNDNKAYDPVYGYEEGEKKEEVKPPYPSNDSQPSGTGLNNEKKAKRRSFGLGMLVGVLVSIAVLFVVLIIVVFSEFYNGFGGIFIKDVESKANFIEEIIHQTYYKDVDNETLTDGIYDGIVGSLGDPYSDYYTPEEYQQLIIDNTGNYSGIGASLQKDLDTGLVYVVYVYDGVPAEKAGIRAGDILVSVDGQKGVDMPLDAFVRLIRGEAGSTVEIVYERDEKEYTVTVTRDSITLPSVDYRMVTDEVGYIRISDFTVSTPDAFREALEDLKSQGMTSVIFDLRDNPGGMVDSVTEILDEILPKGTTVYMEDKNGKRTTYTSDDAKCLKMPIALLINGNSASASEIFAGAIRDFKYGTLIGTQTYGKGVVQITLPLSDGSAVKLTVSQYFTPSGECIDGVGISPDIELEYEYSGDTEADEYDYMADNQVQKAIEILTKE